MNDLDLVRELRADVPVPDRARLAPGRATLLAAVAGPTRPSYLRRAGLPIGIAAAAAAVAGVVVVATGSGSPVPAAPTPAVRILTAASVTVAKQPAVRPGPLQWIHTKSTDYTYDGGSTTDENWLRFDGGQSAYLEKGKLLVHNGPAVATSGSTPLDVYDSNATPLTAYNALASLPSDPKALLAIVDKHVAALGDDASAGGVVSLYAPKSPGEREFDYVSQLLWNAFAGAPPAARAAVFQAMSAIPGVSSQSGISNAVGMPAVGLSANGGRTQLLLDPHSYQVVGMRSMSTGKAPDPKIKGWPAAGAVVESLTWGQVNEVSGPGRS